MTLAIHQRAAASSAGAHWQTAQATIVKGRQSRNVRLGSLPRHWRGAGRTSIAKSSPMPSS
eukprot:scaffold177986_cov47-Prasinocladus_malaysianus.AAC.1